MADLTVCFFGHRRIDDYDAVEQKIFNLAGDLIRRNEYVDFLVGRDGDFDQIAAAAIRRAKQSVFDGNSSLCWVQPYQRAEYLRDPAAYERYYDRIELCEASESAHPKAAIQRRNRVMVDRSQLCVFYVAEEAGGAWQTMQYAVRRQKAIINLSEGSHDVIQYLLGNTGNT